MLDKLERLPADPILGLAAQARADSNPNKVDLTLGVYMNEQGICPVFEAVTRAQASLAEEEVSKSYLPPEGVAEFNSGMQKLVLGAGHPALLEGRVSSVQAPGG